MSRPRILLTACALTLACGPPPTPVELVVHDVTVIDPRSGEVSADRSVFISEGRIAGIEASGRRASFVAGDSLDGTGRFLVPGLLDMHVHLFGTDEVAQPTLDLLLANGVTGFREMASDCWDPTVEGAVCTEALRALAGEVQAGSRIAPRPLALASAPVHGVGQRDDLLEGVPEFVTPGTEEDGRDLARWLADRGVDLVKVYNSVPRDAYFALADEAAGLGLEVSGHLPLGVSVLEASDAGHRTLEHARDLPVACGAYRDAYRDRMARVVSGEEGVEPPSPEERIRATIDAFDTATCEDVFATLVANGTYLVPTHGTREMDYRATDASYRADDRMRYILASIREDWEADLDQTAEASPELVELFGEFYELGIRLTGMAHAAGVKVMAGTDANDTMIFPGSAIHDELDRFAESGMGAMDVLRTATSTPAEYLGRAGELGTVSVGAVADLVLLAADPLDDVGSMRAIDAVILGGRVRDRAALDELLRGVEAIVAASEESGS